MQKEKLMKTIPGFVLAIVVGLLAYWFAGYYKALDALVVGIVLGMVIRTFLGERAWFLLGIESASKFFIPLGIIFYGINLEFHKLSPISAVSWARLVAGIVIIFLVAIYLGKKFGVGNPISLLIATGTAICGASAIAITTPIVKADSEDAGASLITITIFGLFGMMIYPLALAYFALSETQYALFCGTTLHQTGFVKIASLASGENCLALALSIKMARTAMLIPIIGFLCWYAAKNEEKKEKFFLYQVPWFMWVFVLVGLLISFIPTLHPIAKTLKPWSTIFFAIALTSIGLKVNLKRILNVGAIPLLIGLACWVAVIGVFVLGECVLQSKL